VRHLCGCVGAWGEGAEEVHGRPHGSPPSLHRPCLAVDHASAQRRHCSAFIRVDQALGYGRAIPTLAGERGRERSVSFTLAASSRHTRWKGRWEEGDDYMGPHVIE
jgi:hypothetical protein